MAESPRPKETKESPHKVDEEDLDYVTLAKLGGRKDLLKHHEFVRTTSDPVPYPWVDWFDHYPPAPSSLPKLPTTRPQPTLLTWTISDETRPQCPPRGPSISLRHRKPTYPPLVTRDKRKKTKLPSLPNEPVSIMKLLAMDYQKEWVKSNDDRLEEKRLRQKEKKELQKQKLIEHTMKAREIAGKSQLKEEKPRFIMKRFSKVPSKLNLPKS